MATAAKTKAVNEMINATRIVGWICVLGMRAQCMNADRPMHHGVDAVWRVRKRAAVAVAPNIHTIGRGAHLSKCDDRGLHIIILGFQLLS